MKLIRLKLLSKFRSLQAGFEINFHPHSSETPEHPIHPICFVGRNGTGKSNAMELLCEIFYYLETLHLEYSEDIRNINKSLGFEIEYSIPNSSAILYDSSKELSQSLLLQFVKVVKKEGNEPAQFFIKDEAEEYVSAVDKDDTSREQRKAIRNLLPNKVIGYSSGLNELISNPFLRMQFHYYHEYSQQVSQLIFEEVDSTRLFYMNYQTNETVLLANYLMQEESALEVLNKRLEISGLDSFRIQIEKGILLKADKSISSAEKEDVQLLQAFLEDIECLKKCATCYKEQEIKSSERSSYRRSRSKTSTVLTLDYKVDGATKQAFRHYFGNAFRLFKLLHQLTLLNIHKLSDAQIKTVRNSEMDFNISDFLPKLAESELLFNITDIKLKKNRSGTISYNGISDGEHQFMHIVGTTILMNEPATLFLFDEPETHYNPAWRSTLVNTLNQVAANQNRQQVVLLTTHSPFILSDCHEENVFQFSRNETTNYPEAKPIGTKTFGTSFDILLEEAFGKEESISEMASEKIKAFYKMPMETEEDIKAIKSKAYSLGESIEKGFLFDYLNRKLRAIRAQQKKENAA